MDDLGYPIIPMTYETIASETPGNWHHFLICSKGPAETEPWEPWSCRGPVWRMKDLCRGHKGFPHYDNRNMSKVRYDDVWFTSKNGWMALWKLPFHTFSYLFHRSHSYLFHTFSYLFIPFQFLQKPIPSHVTLKNYLIAGLQNEQMQD